MKLLAIALAPSRISFGLLSKSNSTLPKALAAKGNEVAELLPELIVAENNAFGLKSSAWTDALERGGLFLFSHFKTLPALALVAKNAVNTKEETAAIIAI